MRSSAMSPSVIGQSAASITGRVAALVLVSALVLPTAGLVAQKTDDVTLVVKRNGREIGRETFTLRDSRPRDVAGSTLISAVHYPATNPTLTLATTLERTSEFAFAQLQMDVDSSGTSTVVLAAGSGARLTVRTFAKGSEAGRTLPGGPDVVLLDDAIFSLYVQVVDLATAAGRPLTAVFPRTGRRITFKARREQTDDGHIRVTLSGGVTGTLLADARGRLISLELPASQTVVTRSGDGR